MHLNLNRALAPSREAHGVVGNYVQIGTTSGQTGPERGTRCFWGLLSLNPNPTRFPNSELTRVSLSTRSREHSTLFQNLGAAPFSLPSELYQKQHERTTPPQKFKKKQKKQKKRERKFSYSKREREGGREKRWPPRLFSEPCGGESSPPPSHPYALIIPPLIFFLRSFPF